MATPTASGHAQHGIMLHRGKETGMLHRGKKAGMMNRTLRMLVVLLIALVTIGIGVSAADAATPAVPVGGSVSGTVSFTSTTTATLAGTGIVSHLGKVTYAAQAVITGTNPVTGVITDTLTETLTAANGDTLALRCQQVATPISPGVYRGSDTWTVIGGTGRFSGATGSGTGETHVDFNVGTFTKVLTGNITY